MKGERKKPWRENILYFVRAIEFFAIIFAGFYYVSNTEVLKERLNAVHDDVTQQGMQLNKISQQVNSLIIIKNNIHKMAEETE